MSSDKNLPKANGVKQNAPQVDESTRPDFIYGGPFIKVEKPSPFLNTSTPINLELQGTFKKSCAYFTLQERVPIILTKLIDYLSREGNKIKAAQGASDQDVLGFIQYITKLKNDLTTNKKYDLLTVDTPEARKWNEWIQESSNQYYFSNVWVFTECYVYRRLWEGCELSKGLKNFDYFANQKQAAFEGAMEAMCVVANRLMTMLPPSDKDKRRNDFSTLLKNCLWANKCDLSLTMGEQVCLKSEINLAKANACVDPFNMITDFKDKVLIDDSLKASDQVVAKAEAVAKAISGGSAGGAESPPAETEEGVGEGEKKIPCPAKMTIPTSVMFDIVCDNTGYELFSDLCLAHFLISQNIVQKVRFHVKKIPWFISDVTPADFKYTIESCKKAEYANEFPAPEVEGETTEPNVVNADNLRRLGEQWGQYVEDGTFVCLTDDFWTSPHGYRDMKKYAPNLYRNLQFAATVLFKGDLNYRKLLGDKNWVPTTSFDAALQGFMPTPIIAVRTVKADLICGLPKGKFEQISKIDENWMAKGDYGLIQFCGKSEPLKPSDRPCQDYGDQCRGVTCPSTV